MISAVWIALAVLALDDPPTGPSPKPCAATSFAGNVAFLVVGQPVGRESAAIASAQRARARKLEATVIRGQLFEKMGASHWIVYGAFASEADGAAKVAALAKMKIAASVVASGPPVGRAPDWRAPIVRICGDARREAFGGGPLPASDTRFSRIPIAIDLRDVHYVTETDITGYFEIWLKGWGQAQVHVAPFKAEARDRNVYCGFIGRIDSTPAIDEAEVDLPKVAGASVRTHRLGQSILGCGE